MDSFSHIVILFQLNDTSQDCLLPFSDLPPNIPSAFDSINPLMGGIRDQHRLFPVTTERSTQMTKIIASALGVIGLLGLADVTYALTAFMGKGSNQCESRPFMDKLGSEYCTKSWNTQSISRSQYGVIISTSWPSEGACHSAFQTAMTLYGQNDGVMHSAWPANPNHMAVYWCDGSAPVPPPSSSPPAATPTSGGTTLTPM
ncbi:hypothetical protein AMATHDRAFT_49780 [Amanita thiersii Skay4041]|uniref:Uncharacterized protein n=1 Tax=Amanita thiersii Skay4041 TaxID=703135 RepID=A0A2A9NIK2_9AGAR|nr:hypothetical protein AMATHDRAFT_49780 [Amanita thiersii Skay4041]